MASPRIRSLLSSFKKSSAAPASPFNHLNACKREMIDLAFNKYKARSFADLGAVWAVNGGYSFYALENYQPQSAFIVDWKITDEARENAAKYPQLSLVEANFGSAEVAERIGHVDAVFLFDVLLHQVKPDWDEVLAMYAPRARMMLIFNQQYIDFPATRRLVDLPREEYFRLVPEDPAQPHYAAAYDNPEGWIEQQQRTNRDQYGIWQWGITDADLDSAMKRLGFESVYTRNCGPFFGHRHIEDHAFLYIRP
jgi:hypothetical protein